MSFQYFRIFLNKGFVFVMFLLILDITGGFFKKRHMNAKRPVSLLPCEIPALSEIIFNPF